MNVNVVMDGRGECFYFLRICVQLQLLSIIDDDAVMHVFCLPTQQNYYLSSSASCTVSCCPAMLGHSGGPKGDRRAHSIASMPRLAICPNYTVRIDRHCKDAHIKHLAFGCTREPLQLRNKDLHYAAKSNIEDRSEAKFDEQTFILPLDLRPFDNIGKTRCCVIATHLLLRCIDEQLLFLFFFLFYFRHAVLAKFTQDQDPTQSQVKDCHYLPPACRSSVSCSSLSFGGVSASWASACHWPCRPCLSRLITRPTGCCRACRWVLGAFVGRCAALRRVRDVLGAVVVLALVVGVALRALCVVGLALIAVTVEQVLRWMAGFSPEHLCMLGRLIHIDAVGSRAACPCAS